MLCGKFATILISTTRNTFLPILQDSIKTTKLHKRTRCSYVVSSESWSGITAPSHLAEGLGRLGHGVVHVDADDAPAAVTELAQRGVEVGEVQRLVAADVDGQQAADEG